MKIAKHVRICFIEEATIDLPCRGLMEKIDKMLEFLALHEGLCSVEEVSKVLNITPETCKKIADFLAKYDFVHFEGRKLRINPRMKKLFTFFKDDEYIPHGIISVPSSSVSKKTVD